MPSSPVHQKKLKKNLVVFAAILAFCALIWAVTMIKM